MISRFRLIFFDIICHFINSNHSLLFSFLFPCVLVYSLYTWISFAPFHSTSHLQFKGSGTHPIILELLYVKYYEELIWHASSFIVQNVSSTLHWFDCTQFYFQPPHFSLSVEVYVLHSCERETCELLNSLSEPAGEASAYVTSHLQLSTWTIV